MLTYKNNNYSIIFTVEFPIRYKLAGVDTNKIEEQKYI